MHRLGPDRPADQPRQLVNGGENPCKSGGEHEAANPRGAKRLALIPETR